MSEEVEEIEEIEEIIEEIEEETESRPASPSEHLAGQEICTGACYSLFFHFVSFIFRLGFPFYS